MEPRPSTPDLYKTQIGSFLVQVEGSLRVAGVDTQVPNEARLKLNDPDFWFGKAGFWTKMASEYTSAERAQELVCTGILGETQRFGDDNSDVKALKDNLGLRVGKIGFKNLVDATSGKGADVPTTPAEKDESEKIKPATAWLVDEVRVALVAFGVDLDNEQQVSAKLAEGKFWFGEPDSFWNRVSVGSGISPQRYQGNRCKAIYRDMATRLGKEAHDERVSLRALFGLPMDSKPDSHELVRMTCGNLAPEPGAVVTDEPVLEGRWVPLRKALRALRGEPQSPVVSVSELRPQTRDFELPPLEPEPIWVAETPKEVEETGVSAPARTRKPRRSREEKRQDEAEASERKREEAMGKPPKPPRPPRQRTRAKDAPPVPDSEAGGGDVPQNTDEGPLTQSLGDILGKTLRAQDAPNESTR